MEKYEEQRLHRENMKLLSLDAETLLYYMYPQENGEN